jgi:drug/metabolite transporter (DMT)-like permease
MERITINGGVAMILLGVAAYVSSGFASLTAMIPAFFGIPIAALGWLAKDENKKKHAMHGMAVLALLGFLGSVGGFRGLFTLMAGGEVLRPAAVIVQSIMAVICGVLLYFAVQSFIEARRARQAE